MTLIITHLCTKISNLHRFLIFLIGFHNEIHAQRFFYVLFTL